METLMGGITEPGHQASMPGSTGAPHRGFATPGMQCLFPAHMEAAGFRQHEMSYHPGDEPASGIPVGPGT